MCGTVYQPPLSGRCALGPKYSSSTAVSKLLHARLDKLARKITHNYGSSTIYPTTISLRQKYRYTCDHYHLTFLKRYINHFSNMRFSITYQAHHAVVGRLRLIQAERAGRRYTLDCRTFSAASVGVRASPVKTLVNFLDARPLKKPRGYVSHNNRLRGTLRGRVRRDTCAKPLSFSEIRGLPFLKATR